jgi:signal transduction histidine kinase
MASHPSSHRRLRAKRASASSGSRNTAERKRLLQQILEISAKEQQRIGQDLHDGICQHLTAITLLTELLETKLAAKAAPEAADAAEIAKLVIQAIVQTKSVAKGLLPVEWQAEGLTAALRELASASEKRPLVSCRLAEGNPVIVESKVIAVHLFRIAQEAVANALKHARAKHIVISLVQERGRVILRITDDGIGMTPTAGNKGGLGLSIMRSRAETINATLRIRRGVSGGTVLECSLSSAGCPWTGTHLARNFHRRRSYDKALSE